MAIEALAPGFARLIAPRTELEQVATGFRFTEGPLWDPRDGSLLFSDIPASTIYRWREGAGAEPFRHPSGKSNGLTWDREGRLLACEHGNRRVSRTLESGEVVTLAGSHDGKRLNSPNDLVCRSDGAIYFSDPPYGLGGEMGEPGEREQEHNGLYLLPLGGTEPVLLAADFDRPNGLAFSPEEHLLYVADTPRYEIRVFDVLPDGHLAGGYVFARFREDDGAGRPDGMKVDSEGNLYTTGPGGVWVLDQAGAVVGRIRLPEKTANCAWGDADLRSLYITASTSVYRVRVQVPGLPVLR